MPGTRYDASTKAKAIRLVREHAGDYPTQWAAIKAVSGRLGMSAETLRKWIRQAEVDEGKAPGSPARNRPRSGSCAGRIASSSRP
jgi:transposase